ncbi:hypothetical protein OIE69_03225 [Actinacidiphila glaucinigra]|uniref:hypothetical protein n=1 Tax=Actinacidiphila glaucinigra TaxID=235986 RepID=UPI002DDC20FA|nr:hypothetical protein [Actinacidiphila glaucinigra]WSD57980.1 hypothetical protein OIE69_03225 [Actinacidiphila glaucinigra]
MVDQRYSALWADPLDGVARGGDPAGLHANGACTGNRRALETLYVPVEGCF